MKKRIFALALVCLLALSGCNANGNADQTGSTAAPAVDLSTIQAITIGSHTLTAADMNYFYIDAVVGFAQEYGSYLGMLLDTSKPLDQQIYDKETGDSWGKMFLEMAVENARSTYAVYDAALAAGFQLGETEETAIANMQKSLQSYATQGGFASADAYVSNFYGTGATLESYTQYYRVSVTADCYYQKYGTELSFEEADLRQFEADKGYLYNSYSFASYFISASKYRQGGTLDDTGNLVYSDAEKQAALDAAKADADALAAGVFADMESFNAAIQALKINEGEKDVKATNYSNLRYGKINAVFQEWMKEERAPGDMTVLPVESGTGENKTVTGYYVVRMGQVTDNAVLMKNVRHILVQFRSASNSNTFTDAEKNTAKVSAQAILDAWLAGEKTEESFAALATEKTEDPGSKQTGGLYEDIYPGQMVEPFEAWCFDESRQPGDTGLVETTYGYHVMYFSSDAENTYRDLLVESDLRNDRLRKWHEALTEAVSVTELDLSKLSTSISIQDLYG